MIIKSSTSSVERLHLDKNDILRIKKTKPGMALSCEKGILWVTQSGDFRDYLLTQGQNMVVKKHGRVLIEALRDVEFKIESQDKARLN
jgi:hypothetical protein